MNLTPPPPSQNSHAVRWHCTAESERRVVEIKSWFLRRRPTDQQACDRVYYYYYYYNMDTSFNAKAKTKTSRKKRGSRTRDSRPRPGPRTWPSRPKTIPRTEILSLRTTKDQESKPRTTSLHLPPPNRCRAVGPKTKDFANFYHILEYTVNAPHGCIPCTISTKLSSMMALTTTRRSDGDPVSLLHEA